MIHSMVKRCSSAVIYSKETVYQIGTSPLTKVIVVSALVGGVSGLATATFTSMQMASSLVSLQKILGDVCILGSLQGVIVGVAVEKFGGKVVTTSKKATAVAISTIERLPLNTCRVIKRHVIEPIERMYEPDKRECILNNTCRP